MTNSVNTLDHRNWALAKASTVEGYMSTDELTWLYDNAYGQSVEMGSYRGRSGTIIGLKLKEIGGHLSCIDCFGDAEYSIFQENINKSNLSVDVYRMASVEAVDRFDDHSLDFVFIDSSHEYDDTLEEIVEWLPKVKLDGLLCGHDYNHPEFTGLTRAVHELCVGFENPVGSIWCIRASQFSDLQRCLFERLKESRRHLRQNLKEHNEQLLQLKGAVNYYDKQLVQTQGSVNSYQAEVVNYKAQLTQLQGLIDSAQAEIADYKAQLKNSIDSAQVGVEGYKTKLFEKENLVEAKKKRVRHLKRQIEQLKSQNNSLQLEIEAMKTSKFWKLRSLWHRVIRPFK